VEKEIHMPNLGREASSWLLWILNNYCDLPDQVTFLQGKPEDHCSLQEIQQEVTTDYKRHGQLIECERDGSPHHNGLNLNKPFGILRINPQGPVRFCMGAQFTVSKENILKYPYMIYAQLFAYSVSDEQAPWELERVWESMFNK
jgi:hypothetical protein